MKLWVRCQRLGTDLSSSQMKTLAKLFAAFVMTNLSCSLAKADGCGTFHGGNPIINDMISQAVNSYNRTFAEVSDVRWKNFAESEVSVTSACEFTFRYTLEVAVKFKDSPMCTFNFVVNEDVIYSPESSIHMGAYGFQVKHVDTKQDASDIVCE
jgi:hypothetical protein